MHLYCTFTLNKDLKYVGKVGVLTSLKYHLLEFFILICMAKKVYMRQFDWGGRLLKSNGGVRR